MKWAQRTNLIFLTICVEDCKDPAIKVEESKMTFKGVGGTEKKTYEIELEFFKEIDTEVSVMRVYMTPTSSHVIILFVLSEIQVRRA